MNQEETGRYICGKILNGEIDWLKYVLPNHYTNYSSCEIGQVLGCVSIDLKSIYLKQNRWDIFNRCLEVLMRQIREKVQNICITNPTLEWILIPRVESFIDDYMTHRTHIIVDIYQRRN